MLLSGFKFGVHCLIWFSPQIAKEVGSRLGIVKEVEWKQRQDDPSFFMRVKVALLIRKPL